MAVLGINIFKTTNSIRFIRCLSMSAQLRAEKAVEQLKEHNPFYSKYADKIAKLQHTSPEEVLNRIEKANAKKDQKINKAKEQERYDFIFSIYKKLN